jgi:TPP-dependent pyruvate/acetoin dehydrogenase alpha subunit
MATIPWYATGPGGEELMGAVAVALRETDAVALHYRHVATSVARGLFAGRSMEEIIQARARGFVVADSDPVTGGRHCAIGGSFDYDYLVTSTLASQSGPAVGRALAPSVCRERVRTRERGCASLRCLLIECIEWM